MARNISFNGFNMQTDHIFTEFIGDAGAPKHDLSIYELAHANRSTIPYDSWPSRNIPVSGTIMGDSVADLDSRLDAFKAALVSLDKNLDVDYGSGTRRYIATAQIDENTFDRPGGLLYATFNFNFFCSRPFGQDAAPTTLCDYRAKQLISNSTFGTSITGSLSPWTAYNGATLTRPNFTGYAGVTGDLGSGGSSMQIATTGSGANAIQGANYGTIVTVAGTTYTFSAWVKGTAGQTVRIQASDTGGDTFTSSTLIATGVYQRVSVTKTAATTTMTLYLLSENANTAVRTTNWDDTLFEVGTSPSHVFDASPRTATIVADSFVFGGTAPWQQPIITLTINSGTVLTGTIQIGNNTNGQAVTITGTFAVGDILVIDSYNKIVTKNGGEIDFTGAFPEFPVGTGVVGLSHNLTINYNYKVIVYPAYV